MQDHGVLAIDVGSSRVKLGWFPPAGGCATTPAATALAIAAAPLPTPEEVRRVEHQDRPPAEWLAEIERWLDELAPTGDANCLIASVHAGAAGALDRCIHSRQWSRIVHLTARNLPLTVRVAEPERVGVDRLLGALAANRLRRPETQAISVDMGTAITVDLINADGAFEGGAILAGPMLSLAALHAGTSSLPRLDASVLDPPPAAIGKSTSAAMAAGAYWGAIGAVREVVQRLAESAPSPPEVFLTGGAAAAFAPHVGLDHHPARHVPHLVLAGIRLAADVERLR